MYSIIHVYNNNYVCPLKCVENLCTRLLCALPQFQVEVAVPRDPDRLLKLTAGWQERKKAASMIDLDGAGVGVGSRDLPRRAVPAWRQGL